MAKIINHFRQNRAVHLALRDMHYQYATTQLIAVEQDVVGGLHIEDYERILFCLREARTHGRMAIRETSSREKDAEFCKFINLLAGNVKAILSMLNLKKAVEFEGGFIRSALQEIGDESLVTSEGVEHRSRLQYLLEILDVSNVIYEELRQLNRDEFSNSECDRYDKMMAFCKEECGKRTPPAGGVKKLAIFSKA